EETFYTELRRLAENKKYIFLDDFDLLVNWMLSDDISRNAFIDAVLVALANRFERDGCTLILASTGTGVGSGEMNTRKVVCNIPRFTALDYEALLDGMLTKTQSKAIDTAVLFRFAPRLNAHLLRLGANHFPNGTPCSTELFLDFLQKNALHSNIA